MFADCGSNGGIHDITQRCEADNYLVNIAVSQIFDDGCNEHDE